MTLFELIQHIPITHCPFKMKKTEYNRSFRICCECDKPIRGLVFRYKGGFAHHRKCIKKAMGKIKFPLFWWYMGKRWKGDKTNNSDDDYERLLQQNSQ